VGPTKLTGDVVADPLIMETGRLVVPTTPGLGATLDAAAVTGWAVSAPVKLSPGGFAVEACTTCHDPD